MVDDDAHISDVLAYALSAHGYRVETASDADGAVKAVEAREPDIMVLDINLPGKDGLWACRKIREFSQVPIIFLSARDEELDRVMGLIIGGDDYVTKPFSPRELAARLDAILRRRPGTAPPGAGAAGGGEAGGPPAATHRALPPADGGGAPGAAATGGVAARGTRIEAGPLSLDTEGFEAFWEGRRVELTATEFRLLRTLARRPRKVFSREELLGLVFPAVTVSDRTVDSHILHIRKKFQKEGGEVIQTRHGVGYCLAPLGRPPAED